MKKFVYVAYCYRALENEVMKANEHLTTKQLASSETACFMHKNKNENLPPVCQFLPTKQLKFCKR